MPKLPEFELIINSKVSQKYKWHSLEKIAFTNSIKEIRTQKARVKKRKIESSKVDISSKLCRALVIDGNMLCISQDKGKKHTKTSFDSDLIFDTKIVE